MTTVSGRWKLGAAAQQPAGEWQGERLRAPGGLGQVQTPGYGGELGEQVESVV